MIWYQNESNPCSLGWSHQRWRILGHVLSLSCAVSSSSCCCWAALRSSGLCITHWRSHWAMWSSGSCPASARDGEVTEAAGAIGVERWRNRCLRRSPGRKRSMTRAWSCKEWWTRRPKRVSERDTKASYQPEQHDQSHCAYVLTQDSPPSHRPSNLGLKGLNCNVCFSNVWPFVLIIASWSLGAALYRVFTKKGMLFLPQSKCLSWLHS